MARLRRQLLVQRRSGEARTITSTTSTISLGLRLRRDHSSTLDMAGPGHTRSTPTAITTSKTTTAPTISATSGIDKLNSYRKYGNLLPITQMSSRRNISCGHLDRNMRKRIASRFLRIRETGWMRPCRIFTKSSTRRLCSPTPNTNGRRLEPEPHAGHQTRALHV